MFNNWKNRFLREIPLLALIPFLVSAAASTAAGEITVEAFFDPARLSEGSYGRYIIQVTQRSDERGDMRMGNLELDTLPEVEGLQLGSPRRSTSTRTNIVNNRVGRVLTSQLTFDVQATGTGTYDIPQWTVRFGGGQLRIPAARLEVVERGPQDGPRLEDLVFMRAELPETLFVGQSIHVPLSLYLQDRVAIRDHGNPRRRGDGFLVSPLGAPQGGRQMHENEIFRIYQWDLRITPITAGDLDFGFTMPLVIADPNASAQRTNDPFGRMFDQRPNLRLDLDTGEHSVRVRPLPATGRPESFSGAIGRFEADTTIPTTEGKVGEPLVLTVRIKGTGNFDRIGAPPLPSGDDWTVNAGEGRFQADDTLGLSGQKTFEYTLIPRRDGELDLPPLEFSSFDPETENYYSLALDTPTFTIAPGRQAPEPVARKEVLKRDDAAGESQIDVPVFRTGTGISRPTLPAISTIQFLGANAAAALGLTLVFATLRLKHRLRTEPAFAVRHRALGDARKADKALRRATAQGDISQAQRAAEQLISASMTAALGRSTASMTASEKVASLRALKIREETVVTLRSLLQRLEDSRYHPPSNSTANDLAGTLETNVNAEIAAAQAVHSLLRRQSAVD